MSKRIISILLAVLLLCGLASCGKSKSIGSSSSYLTNKYKENTEDPVPYDVTSPKPVNTEECRSAYAAFLKNYIASAEEISAEAARFALIYVDEDNAPELVLSTNDYHAARAELYYYDGGSVKKVGDYGQWGTLGYVERKGVIVDFFSQSGTNDQTVYSFSDGAVKELCYYTQKIDVSEKFDENAEEVELCYINDEEVSAEEYNRSYSENVPGELVVAPESSHSDTYPLTENGITSCFGNDSAPTKTAGAEADADAGAAKLYAPVLKNYGKERVEKAGLMGETISTPSYEYAVKDINADGVDELVIREKDDDAGVIGAVYTLKNGTPLELYFIERHGSCVISSDGYFINLYHEVTIEKLEGDKLVTVAESSRLSDGNYDAEYKAFLNTNGVSTEEMTFDFVPYNG